MAFERLKNRQFLNLLTGLFCQIIVALSGLILPGMIIRAYGSVLNGLISIVTQVMAYLSLVEAGLASASLVSLYKPLAEKDYTTASSILVAIKKFYVRVAYLFLIGSFICGFALIFVVKDDIPLTTIWLVTFAVAGSNFVTFLLLNKYKVLLQADNRIYIVNIVHTLAIIIQFIVSVLLIHQKINIASIKMVIIITNTIEWAMLSLYTRFKLPDLKTNVPPKKDAIKQRKDIIVHQILSLVLNNTDVILLALFCSSLDAVSVYTIYAMVGTFIHNILNSFVAMFSAKMGQRYAVRDYDGVRAILNKYELIYDIALFSLYGCMAIMILPFISVYTRGVSDVNYYLPLVGLLFSVYGLTRMLRLPFSELTFSAGHFKETKIQAVLEASINLIVSVILLPFMGIPGVLIGSIAGEIYRTIHTYYYCQKRLIRFDWIRSIVLMIANCFIFVFLICLFNDYSHIMIDSYFVFAQMSIFTLTCVFVLVLVTNYAIAQLFKGLRR